MHAQREPAILYVKKRPLRVSAFLFLRCRDETRRHAYVFLVEDIYIDTNHMIHMVKFSSRTKSVLTHTNLIELIILWF